VTRGMLSATGNRRTATGKRPATGNGHPPAGRAAVGGEIRIPASRHSGIAAFPGFPRDTVTFLRALARNNTEAWVEAHRARYDAALLTPARQCVVAVGEALHAVGCRVVADPRVNGSIFRMARDRRFRPDAPPYKTHLALLWWAEGVRMAQPSFYLQIDGKGVELGVGLPEIPRDRLPDVRRWLVEGDHASRFLAAMDVASDAGVEWSMRQLARPPLEFRGLDEARSQVVRYTGGWGGWTLGAHPPELFTAEFAGWLVEKWRPLIPFWRVFTEALAPSR
jgi:uncharacterized protein (TIGR02453 family)